mmetsp:Transcript_17512/g.26220  ORF Transcript_17512/g.26220 Transcript_17512/m.26220 type:complete len:207 (+) Transcript_17512:50-670(+)
MHDFINKQSAVIRKLGSVQVGLSKKLIRKLSTIRQHRPQRSFICNSKPLSNRVPYGFPWRRWDYNTGREDDRRIVGKIVRICSQYLPSVNIPACNEVIPTPRVITTVSGVTEQCASKLAHIDHSYLIPNLLSIHFTAECNQTVIDVSEGIIQRSCNIEVHIPASKLCKEDIAVLSTVVLGFHQLSNGCHLSSNVRSWERHIQCHLL